MKSSMNIAHLFHSIRRRIAARTICCAQPRQGTGCNPAAWLLGLVLMMGLPPGLHAQEQVLVPELVNYQGRLESLDTNKTYIDGVYTIEFRIWDSAANTNTDGLLWGESYNVYVKGGSFNLILNNSGGPVKPMPIYNSLRDALRTTSGHTDRYLGLTVNQDKLSVECVPRQQMLSAPFAFQSQYAQYAYGAGTNLFMANNGIQVSGGALTASGSVQFNNGLTVSGAQATLQNGLTVSGPATLTSGLDVSGSTILRGTVGLACSTTNGGFVPVGGIIMWSGTTIPSGWALCDGTTTINGVPVPDLRGRFVLGKGQALGNPTMTAYAIGQKGGEETHKLIPSEMPAHSHYYRADQASVVMLGGQSGDNADSAGSGGFALVNPLNTASATQSMGGDAPHNNMPPYYVLAYIIRVQ